MHEQWFLTNPHTFVPQDIVQITESTGLLYHIRSHLALFFVRISE